MLVVITIWGCANTALDVDNVRRAHAIPTATGLGESMPKQTLQRPLFLAALTFLCGLSSAAVLWQFDNTGTRMVSISLLATPVMWHLAWLITSARARVNETVSDGIQDVRDALSTNRVGRHLAAIRRPFCSKFAEKSLDPFYEGLRELAGDRDNYFPHEGAYMAHASKIIDSMREGDQILAICGDKNWRDELVKGFNDRNCKAAARNIEVKRLFLQIRKSGFSKDEKHVLRMHYDAKGDGGSIEPLVIDHERAVFLMKSHGLPNGFGLTYMRSAKHGERVLIHWGLGRHDREGLRLESPTLVRQFLEMFADFEAAARKLDPARDL